MLKNNYFTYLCELMKRVLNIMTILLLTFFLFGASYHYVNADTQTGSQTPVPTDLIPSFSYDFPMEPVDINTLNHFFPFYQDMVCWKPVQLNKDVYSLKNYHFEKFDFNKKGILNGNFIKIDGNGIYKKGNATLLIPRAYMAPSKSFFYPERQKIFLQEQHHISGAKTN